MEKSKLFSVSCPGPRVAPGVSFRQHFLAACAHKLAARLRNGGGQQRLSQLPRCGLLRSVYAGGAGGGAAAAAPGCIKPINQRATANKKNPTKQTVVRQSLRPQRCSAYLINMESTKHELILTPFKVVRIFTKPHHTDNPTRKHCERAFLI